MMRVPEAARLREGPLGSDPDYGCNGAFTLPSPEPGWALVIIASDGNDPDVPEGDGWEHVSVHSARIRQTDVVGLLGRAESVPKARTPTWREMCFVKDTFWEPEDVVIQYHPRRSEYVNCHPNTLHLWRSRTQPIPEPPAILVGPKG